MIIGFDDVEIDLDAFEIRRDGRPVHIEPQVFDVVRVLVERRGHLVTKDDLLDTVWGTRFVSESSLTSRIKAARRALGDDGRAQRVIATVHGRGYRFVADAAVVASTTMGPHADTPPTGASPVESRLLERDGALATLAAAVGDAQRGIGRVLLVGGEAGIGKTSLVRAFESSVGDRVRRLHGACDDLVTPRALGPFDDMSIELPALADALTDLAPGNVQRALLTAWNDGVGPWLVVVEDAHWADEATIDVLTHLVGRVEQLPVTLILTFRDDEVADGHPLLRVLARVPAAIARHVRLQPLSVDAIAELVGSDRAEEVAGATGGIPFFVTEVASLDPDERSTIPTSVTHAVLARVASLPDPTRQLLDQISVEPSRTAVDVLDHLRDVWTEAIAPAERIGIVTTSAGWVAFRHELARRAVLAAMPASRRRAMHQAMALALVQAEAEPDRIVHHADGAGNHDLLIEYAIPAAERSIAVSAHRQAWSHYQRVLPLLDRVPPDRVPRLLETASHEAYHVDALDEARELAIRALHAFESAGDDASVGRMHRWLSRVHWSRGRREESHRHARLAVEVLDPLGPSEELAWSYSTLSQLAMLSWDDEATIRDGNRALELAEIVGAEAVRAHALVNLAIGTDRAGGADLEMLEEALAIGRATGQHHEVARGLLGAAYGAMELDRLDVADRFAAEALAHATEHEIETLRVYIRATLARIVFLRGEWSAASSQLHGLSGEVPTAVNRMAVLRTLAQLAVRRGDADVDEMIGEHRTLVDASGELQRILPAVEIEAELAWFRGQLDRCVPDLREALPDSAASPAHMGRIARWLREAGALDEIPDGVPEPHLAELEGRWGDAAGGWRDLGMPYEEAFASARAGAAGRRRAREIADRLGARPLAEHLAST